ncbi:MAG: hypothetical protein HQM14_13120 [SAR324 cluster bacterium]|nr:hypothetical protein [SAR324 cluster bacterium]
MKKGRPSAEKWHLYCWNAQDGYLGLPKRQINISPLHPCLLHVAFLKEALLCLVLESSPSTQSDLNYYKFFDLYNEHELSQKFSISVTRLTGDDRARWLIKHPVLEQTEGQMDKVIENILIWHNTEIKRILNYQYRF